MAPARTRIKICGITRKEDAQLAAAAGVDALGFIFHAPSPRAIDPETARLIIDSLPPLVDAVGVFVDKDAAVVEEIVRRCRLDYAQLHGSESPAFCAGLAARIGSCRLLKAFRVGPHLAAGDLAPYLPVVSGFLLDTFRQGVAGGTGEVFDWSIIDRLEVGKPFLLAGGLDVQNIGEALARVRPYGVDANSGLESAPGIKDHALISRFVRVVRDAERSLSPLAP